MLDIISKVDTNAKIHYVFFDTGLEYDATKRHLDDLEKKYNIEIKRIRPEKPIPVAVKEFGVPFKRKYLSGNIERCQRHGFQWEDEPFETLAEKYPEIVGMCKWWTNQHYDLKTRKSMYNINYYRGLKEFMTMNKPDFKISNKCCTYAKKKVAKGFVKEYDIDLSVTGLRKAEGGVRSVVFKNCFTDNSENNYEPDHYRPLFFFTDEDRKYYKEYFNLTYSDCYEVWGMDRTGCVGCPFDKYIEEDLQRVAIYEPQKYKACINLFGRSYDYHKQFKEYQKATRNKKNENEPTFMDYLEEIKKEGDM